jgi:CheY-like chemotaxis protein
MSAGISPQLASARLLVADDQPHILAALEILLHGEGYQTDRALNPENVVQALQEQEVRCRADGS